MKYIKGRFIVDLLAAIPYDTLLGNYDGTKYNFQFKIICILKLGRLLRFAKIINFLNTFHTARLFLKLFKLIFYLLVYLHLQACAWFTYTK